MNGFVHYKDITRKILDTIKVGDEILVNNWTDPMTVKCVSENYFVMTCVKDEDTYYSVCSKNLGMELSIMQWLAVCFIAELMIGFLVLHFVLVMKIYISLQIWSCH